MRGHPFTPEQEAWLRAEGAWFSRRALTLRYLRRWPWPRRSVGAIRRKCCSLGVPSLHSGDAFRGRFRAGREGRCWLEPGQRNAGQFGQPGRPTGAPQHPIGTERFVAGWGVLVKVGAPGRWMRKARWIWERAHGPVPEGMVVAQIDGDPWNHDPANLALVSRAVVAAVNKRVSLGHYAPDGAARAVAYGVARVEAAARRRCGEAGPA